MAEQPSIADAPDVSASAAGTSATQAPAANAPAVDVSATGASPADARSRSLHERLQDPVIARDCRTLGGMTQIWCADHHDDALRTPYEGLGARAGVYKPGKLPRLCPECAAHLEYGEARRALCPKDPKPSCHACDVHCYKPQERAWQQKAMAYAGPRAMFRGMFVDAMRHLWQELRGRRMAKRQK